MIVLCVGVMLAGYTRLVTADSVYGSGSGDYTVRTSVPGPPPILPATIEDPDEAAMFKSSPITVSGNCPTNTYVSLTRNGTFTGIGLCDAAGSYHISTDLYPGNNQLVATDYNFTDVAGPVSAPVTVNYQPPVVVVSTDGSNDSSAADITFMNTSSVASNGQTTPTTVIEPLILKTDFHFQGYYSGDATHWQFGIEGGDAPYAVSVEWGDGQHNLISLPDASGFTATHTYAKAGAYHGSYIIEVTATDANGHQTTLQSLAIINDRPAAAPTTGSSSKPFGLSGLSSDSVQHVLRYAWPTYGVTVLMVSSFWLGERRELKAIKPLLHRSHRA